MPKTEAPVLLSRKGDGVCKLKTNSGTFARANSGRIESKHWFDLHSAYSALGQFLCQSDAKYWLDPWDT